LKAGKQTGSSWVDFIHGLLENSRDEVFRLDVVDHNLAEWSFTRWSPSPEQWMHLLLVEQRLLNGWRSLSSQVLLQRLLPQAKDVYAPLWNLTLDNLFDLWQQPDSGFDNSSRLSQQTIANCMKAAHPLLRPDFDAAGGSGLSSISYLGLLGRPEWQHCRMPDNTSILSKWETVYTGDPYTGLFIQVRHAVPLLALVDLVRPARLKYENLPSEKIEKYTMSLR
jgi:hypothetical protein